MFDPPHPGELLRESYIKPLNLNITHFAKVLGVTRQNLSKIVNEKTGISPEMALRLSKALNTDVEFWINAQVGYDIAQARKNVDLDAIECINCA